MKIKKHLLTICASLLVAHLSFAQNFQFAYGFGNSTNDYELGQSITADANGNIYMAGTFDGASVTFGSITLNGSSAQNIFLVKFNSSGTVLWGKSISSSSSANYSLYDIDADNNGNIYMMCVLPNTTTIDTLTLTSGFSLLKFDTNGNAIWGKKMNGVAYDLGVNSRAYEPSIAVDGSANVYVTGFVRNLAANALIVGNDTIFGNDDIFIAKFNASGTGLWAKTISGPDDEVGCDITTDASGNVYITGFFESDSVTAENITLYNSTPNSGFSGTYDIIVVKYSTNGNLLWAQTCGGNIEGSYQDIGKSIATDASGNVYVTGEFESPTQIFGNYTLTNVESYQPGSDVFIVKYDTNGNVQWAKSAGSTDDDTGLSVATEGSSVYLTGVYRASEITFGGTTFTELGFLYPKPFFVKYNSNGGVVWAKETGGNDSRYCSEIVVGSDGNVYGTGTFDGTTISFDGITLTRGPYNSDAFLVKLGGAGGIGNCSAFFDLYPDSAPHAYNAVNRASGATPLTYTWQWGDGNSDTGAYPSHTYNNAGNYTICLTITDAVGCSDTYCNPHQLQKTGNAMVTVNVVSSLPTAISYNFSSDVSIYPNPATNFLMIEAKNLNGENIRFKCFDSFGTIVQEFPLERESTSVNISQLPAGVYFYSLQQEGAVVNGKFTIIR